jgi:hypothetical protein
MIWARALSARRLSPFGANTFDGLDGLFLDFPTV